MKRVTEKTLQNLMKELWNGREDILHGYTSKQLTKLKEQLEGPENRFYGAYAQITINLPGFTQEARYNRLGGYLELPEQSGTKLKELIVVEIRNRKVQELGL